MSDIAIKVDHLSKKYRIGAAQLPYRTLRDTLVAGVRGVYGSIFRRALSGDRPDEIWALDDVSFEVKQGEVVGIIGRNGAGKSTLLKVLAHITTPTRGRVEIHGRVGSLLEVGTGFHPELTGRENVYLNGAILGMKKFEIERKFDEIVAFAEIEKFLDTPVKHYSSGMYMRLAFAVAAHLEPEILLVDEVLAVGDAEFQKKCLGKIGDVAHQGKTVFFVSHNMAAINNLCKSSILLDGGRLLVIEETDKVIREYLTKNITNHTSVTFSKDELRKGNKCVFFSWAAIKDSSGNERQNFYLGDDIILEFGIISTDAYVGKQIKLSIELRTSDGVLICNLVDVDSHFSVQNVNSIETISVKLENLRFYPDTYLISLWVGSVNSIDTYDYVSNCLNFEITSGGNLTSRNLPRSSGLLFLTPEWKRLNE